MTRRYPIGPLLELARTSLRQVQKRGNISGREYQRYRDEGVSPIVASRLANLYGFHPAEIWPNWVADTIEDAGRDCRNCGARFIPDRKGQVFCSVKPCQRRWWSREMNRRRRQPGGVERDRHLTRMRSYYQETADYQRKQRQARYWQDPEKHRAARRERWARTGR